MTLPPGLKAAAARATATCAVCCAAFLVIAIQPATTTFFLPRTGGSPFLWHAMQVGFLALFTLGNALVALVLPRVSSRSLALAVLGLAILTFVPTPQPEPESLSTLGALRALVLIFGPTFLGLSTLSVGVQLAWAKQFSGSDPYWLYAAGNVGSLAAAYSYSFIIEPNVGVSSQLLFWKVLSATVLGVAAFVMWRADTAPTAPVPEDVPARCRLRWMALGAGPVGLSLACTSYLTLTFGAQPAVWLAPFAIYLTTLALAFTVRGQVLLLSIARATPAAVVVACAILLQPPSSRLALFVGHLALVGVLMAAWNVRLASLRPAPVHLASFYRDAAVGGLVASGIVLFAVPVLLDPSIYPRQFLKAVGPLFVSGTPEYLLFLLVGLFLTRLGLAPRQPSQLRLVEAVALGVALIFGLGLAAGAKPISTTGVGLLIVLAGTTVFRIRTQFSGVAAVVTVASLAIFLGWSGPTIVHWQRSAFGQILITERVMDRVLTNGRIVHGAQSRDCARGFLSADCVRPTTYYADSGPIGAAVRTAFRRSPLPPRCATHTHSRGYGTANG